MMIVHLSQNPPNMSSIGALCDRLGKTFLTFLLGNLWATGGLRVNSSRVKVKLIIFPLFLPRGLQYCQSQLRKPVLFNDKEDNIDRR